ncbi:MAG TPA: alpha-amylase family glycosyl hydrolase, partial [Polyangiaceae bacterium]
VDPLFGTLADMRQVLDAAHARRMKVILDFVPNHTSDQHPWFVEARSSLSNPKRDWYLWRDAKPEGGAPNNWLSVFGGPAWTWDELTGQYYYHAFLKEQPDLNWRNPEVRTAMYAAMRFWLEFGVDGFRVDVLWHLVKDERWRENPKNPDHQPSQGPYESLLPAYSTDQPEVHGIVAEMRAVLDEFPERVLIGEVYLPVQQLVRYYGSPTARGAHLPFNFQLITLPWDAARIAAAIDEYEGALPPGAWPNWVLGNHDQSRIATRVGPAQARVAAVLLLTLRGTPTLYYGDELGLRDGVILADQVQDPQGKRIGRSRDPERTPMPWTSEPGAGFTEGKPWLPFAEDPQRVNVQSQRADPGSMLSLYRHLIELRRRTPALSVGAYAPVPRQGDVIAYVRSHGSARFLIALNLGLRPTSLPTTPLGGGKIVVATDPSRHGQRVQDQWHSTGDDAVVIELDV